MARPKKAALSFEGKSYKVRFRDYAGERTKKSLRTDCEQTAKRLHAQLETLINANDPAIHAPPACALVDTLFYGEPRAHDMSDEAALVLQEYVDVAENPGYMATLMAEEIARLRAEGSYRHRYEDLTKTIEARRAEASAKCPNMTDAIKKFSTWYEPPRVEKATWQCVMRRIEDFDEFADVRSPADVTTIDIEEFLDYDAKGRLSEKNRKIKARSQLSRFFRQAAKWWDFENPVANVETVKYEPRPIIWHQPEDVNKVIDTAPEHLQAIYAMLAYTGCNPKELAGVRVCDVNKYIRRDKGVGLEMHFGPWVINGFKHSLKRDQRTRTIKVPSEVMKYLESHKPGEQFYFQTPSAAHRRKDNRPDDMWSYRYLCALLCSYLPDGMLVRDFRRCAANYFIRNGLSSEQGAAILGNSVVTFERHYGRYEAREIEL